MSAWMTDKDGSIEVALTINGFPVNARYSRSMLESFCLPFLRKLTELQATADRRIVAFLAAPPAVGKSTLAAFLEMLSRNTPGICPLQTLGMDGFHHKQAYILQHTVLRDGHESPMKAVKGVPESFDLEKLQKALARLFMEEILWPVYDRRIHDVVEDQIRVIEPVVLVEGNWLLLQTPGWRDLRADYSVFISGREASLRERLIQRKMQGGLTRGEAEAFYQRCDGPNIRLCMTHSRRGDINLRLNDAGDYIVDG